MNNGFDNNILLQADDFYKTYLRCIEGKNHRIENGTEITSVLNIPAIVNAAFACELYFKSLIGKELRSHNLIGFYNKLPSRAKKELQIAYMPKKIIEHKTIKQALEVVKNTFVDWRYLYKEENASQCNAKDLNTFLRIFQVILPLIKEIAHKSYKS